LKGERKVNIAPAEMPAHGTAIEHSNQGNALQAIGRYEEAIASYDRAIELRPELAGAYSDRGNALQMLKRYDEALASYDIALSLRPDFAKALLNRGSALQKLQRYHEALASYDPRN
jgi:tetratricopeptide (TPR) repeat protein